MEYLEELELRFYSTRDRSLEPNFAAQMLGYLINWKLESARFLFKRLPEAIQANKDIEKTRELLKLLWNMDQGTLVEVMPYIRSQFWPDTLRPLVDIFVEVFQEKIRRLVSKAYSRISLSTFAALMGIDTELARRMVVDIEWVIEGQDVVPTPLPESGALSVDELKALTDFVISLERD